MYRPNMKRKIGADLKTLLGVGWQSLLVFLAMLLAFTPAAISSTSRSFVRINPHIKRV